MTALHAWSVSGQASPTSSQSVHFDGAIRSMKSLLMLKHSCSSSPPMYATCMPACVRVSTPALFTRGLGSLTPTNTCSISASIRTHNFGKTLHVCVLVHCKPLHQNMLHIGCHIPCCVQRHQSMDRWTSKQCCVYWSMQSNVVEACWQSSMLKMQAVTQLWPNALGNVNKHFYEPHFCWQTQFAWNQMHCLHAVHNVLAASLEFCCWYKS